MSTNISNPKAMDHNEHSVHPTTIDDDVFNEGNSTPDSDDNTQNAIAVESFERFRDQSTSPPKKSPPLSDSIAEYCAESLYSYSFTPLSRVTKAAKIKRQILSRGMDYMQRIRYQTRERDTRRRYSQPDIGVLDQNNDWIDSNNQKLKLCPSLNDIVKNDAYTDVLSPNPQHTKLTSSTLSTPIPRSDVDEDGFLFARRQTIDAFLPPIYENTTPPLPCAAQYTRALHAPSRFLPQNQAILTTDADATILLFNDMASLCFGIDKSYVGKSILDELEEPFKSQISNILKRRRSLASIVSNMTVLAHESRMEKGLVLVCGIVVPIRKMNGETFSAASLWLKEKKTDEGKTVYIWIFEEIYETSLSAHLDERGNVLKVFGTTKELFGYEPDEIIGQPITQLVPALSDGDIPGAIRRKLDKVKFYGGETKQGIYFPLMVNISSSTPNKLKIVSLPSIAGLITVHHTGRIQSINPVPAKYLFGYSPESLIEKIYIDQIIPCFSQIVQGLRKCHLLQYASTVNNRACRWAISDMYNPDTDKETVQSLERKPSVSANGSCLPVIHAVHRDGSQFEIQMQLRLIESEEEDLISVWVTYDRIYSQRRVKKKKQQVPVKEETIKSDKEDEDEVAPLTIKKKRPPIRPYGISSFGSVDQKKALFPGGLQERSKTDSVADTVKSLEVKKHPMDDYVIIGTLGEGAYGMAKLAYRKDDVTKTKVVIKFIAKSRIIVDSWIRDRQLGLIPLEIHILKKLKEFPQVNCCALETYMEDEDTYFVVMKLFGNNSMDLFDYIELNEHIPEEEIRSIFKQVALAVQHIQNLRIVHRDIKDENILLDDTGCVHLIDFGSAAYFRKGRTFDTFGGTLDYCAPEILKGMPYEGPPQDIWSLGTLLYTLIYRENPFYNVDEIMEHDLRIPFIMSEGSLDLIKKMLNRDVDKRCSISEVLAHPWLTTSS